MRHDTRKGRRSGFGLVCILVNHAFLCPASANSFLNLNIKSRALSGLLNNLDENIQTVFFRDTLQDSFDKMLHVDFSGQFETKIFGPHADDEPLAPLFETKESQSLPAFLVGCHYDFSRSRFGATSIEAALRWRSRFQRQTLGPSLVEVRTRKDLLDNGGHGQECMLQWDILDRSPAVIMMERACKLTRVSCRVPLHARVDYLMRVTSNADGGLQKENFEAQDWWLPNVLIRPDGILESCNSATVRNPIRHHGRRRDLGIRFLVRRQLNWSVFPVGDQNADDEARTLLAVELQELDAPQSSSFNLRVQTLLERPLESLHLSIVQQLDPAFAAKR